MMLGLQTLTCIYRNAQMMDGNRIADRKKRDAMMAKEKKLQHVASKIMMRWRLNNISPAFTRCRA
jgi:hypothetical protein